MICHIAHTEDAARYVGPVRFWNSQLCNVLAVGEDALKRARDKCVESGWIKYERATNRSIGHYWVTIPPDIASLDDIQIEPSSESSELIEQQEPLNKYPQNTGNDAGIDDGIPANNGESRGYCPGNHAGTSNPSPNPKEEGASSGEDPGKKKSKNKEKVKQDTDPLFDPLAMDLPFDSDEFRESWSDWVDHRIKIKLPLTEIAAKRQLKRCVKMGEEVSLRQIDRSITSGKWIDIYEPDENQAKNEPPKVDTSTAGILGSLEKAGYRCVE